jgi:quinol monooxygenase YgiN
MELPISEGESELAGGHLVLQLELPDLLGVQLLVEVRRQIRSAPMVIVAGHITVEPQQRESYLAGCVRIVKQARRPVGCLDVVICTDLVDPGPVSIFERWESQAALETFRSSGPDTEQGPAMFTVSVQEYDIADVRAGFGEGAE